MADSQMTAMMSLAEKREDRSRSGFMMALYLQGERGSYAPSDRFSEGKAFFDQEI
jgi:hypothetical protein